MKTAIEYVRKKRYTPSDLVTIKDAEEAIKIRERELYTEQDIEDILDSDHLDDARMRFADIKKQKELKGSSDG